MKKYDVCIRAFIMGNMGDDLFVHTLCARYPDKKFVVCGEEKYKEQFNEIKNLTYICTDAFWIKWIFRLKKLPAWTFNCIMEKLGKDNRVMLAGCFEWLSTHSKVNVLISGSIFIQVYSGVSEQHPFFLSEKAYYKRHPYVMGCNFGPYKEESYREFYMNRFYEASQVTFRDEYSSSLFPKGCSNWAPDILFTYDVTNAIKPNLDNYVVISVINLIKDGENNHEKMAKYEDAIICLIRHILENNKKVVLLGFCKEQGDADIIKRIQEKVSTREGISSCCYPEVSVEEIIGYIAYSENVIASRFHAMILGWVCGKIVMPISYNEKVINTINSVRMETPILTIEEIVWGTKDIIKVYHDCIEKARIADVSMLKEAAMEHFRRLDSILG